MKRTLTRLAAAAALAFAAGAADAADVTIGARADPSVDPHFLYLSTNMAYSRHIFDALVGKDAATQRTPGLALSWKPVEPKVWEFRLRPGVRFHDGSAFTAEDVVFSIERVSKLPNNPNPYTNNIRPIVRMEIVDPLTIRFHTDEPSPQLPGLLGNVFIVSKKAAAGAGPEDFRSGKAAIGTGPYRFGSLAPGSEFKLARWEGYWGERPPWDNVTFRIIPSDTARVAALLAGDVEAIDFVASTDVANLEKNPRTSVFKKASDRFVYLGFDVGRTQSPFVKDIDGNELPDNPLRDVRVRRAIALSIDRPALVERVMEGLAVATDQLAASHIGGYAKRRPPQKADPAAARALLAEAGYPKGFSLTLHCPRDRWVNDAKVCQAVGQMMARIGIKMQVETMPANVFFTRNSLARNEFSMWLGGWAHSSTGDISAFLTSTIHSVDPARRIGSINRGRFSDPAIDALIMGAVTEMDDAKGDQLLIETMEAVLDAMPVVPLHTLMTIVAARKGLVFEPRADEQTVAMGLRPAP
ncbi:MAG: ABC transporter substrate-binding protein [Alphaproteobacteria bacterium]